MSESDAPALEDQTDWWDNMIMYTGYVLYALFLLGAVVVLINMLIAMMSNTFQEIQVEIYM